MRLSRLLLALRLPTPALERRYRQEQRGRQAWFTVRMIQFGAACIALYWIVAFATFDLRTALGVVRDQAAFVPILLAYAWVVRRPIYVDAWWAEVALYVSLQPSLYQSVGRIAATHSTGWSFNAQLCYSLMLSMAFACLNFTAAVVAYLGLALASIAYLAAVLVFRAYPIDVVAHTMQNYVFFVLIVAFLNFAMDRKARATFLAQAQLDAERAKSDRLVANMLPAPIAERLKQNEAVADSYDDIVVVFVDLVGFTPMSQKLGPSRIVELLNSFFERADRGTDLFGLEKVKTIGDAYMAVAGAMTKPPRPAKAAVDFAVFLRGQALEAGRAFDVTLRLHIGIASGPAIGGVIATKKLTYDYWGHTVNLAARLQDSVGADGIAVSHSVWEATRDSYPFGPPRSAFLKGVGETSIYDLDLSAS
ncbi:MAG TPA: adenylate/guanylate cyclase domain-containing protein [Novosphingobium sp.]|nr:adenylate/guanylate cyclase domain-containing protein [Novosphingobium sp.]